MDKQPVQPSKDARGFADAFESNPRLLVVEAFMFAAIAVIGAAITYETVTSKSQPSQPQAVEVPSLLEAESLQIVNKTGDFLVTAQDTSIFPNGRWSGGRHLFAATHSPRDAVSFKLPARQPGRYDLKAYLTKSYDYGIVQFYVNDSPVGAPVDLWSYAVESTDSIQIAEVTLQGENDVIRIEVVGKNDRTVTPFYQFGIDGFVLEPTPPSQ